VRPEVDFSQNQAIYLQIVDLMMENVLEDIWMENERIPSVRDFASLLAVNPNTVMRSYSYLEEKGIIHNQRGIGYFLSPQAKQKVLQTRRDNFITAKMPPIFKEMELLGFTIDEINEQYQNYKNNGATNENKH
jgi:GntR family transcriptional regulator